MKSFQDKVCVITGGSSGIGLAIASQLAADGARLLLVARNLQALEDAAAELRQKGAREVRVLSADVSDDRVTEKLSAAIHEMAPAADLVINAAGIVSGGLIEDVPMEEWRRLHELNVLGVVRVLQASLPAMRSRAESGGPAGHVVNIASGAGLVGMSGMGPYGATKAALVLAGNSLRAELDSTGIGVTTVCPGFVRTPIANKFVLIGRINNERTERGIRKWFDNNSVAAELVAQRTLDGVRKRRPIVVIGRDAVSGYWAQRFAPGLLDRMLRRAGRRMSGGANTASRPSAA